jgi:hypothetical protein
MTAGGETGNLLRRVVVPRLHLIPGVREKILDSTTPALHRSELVMKSRGRRQLAGGLCPNLVVVDGKRLDEGVGARFAVITSASLNPFQRDEVTRRGVVVVSAHPGTELALWLQADRARAAVVRPDRTVMWAGRHEYEKKTSAIFDERCANSQVEPSPSATQVGTLQGGPAVGWYRGTLGYAVQIGVCRRCAATDLYHRYDVVWAFSD